MEFVHFVFSSFWTFMGTLMFVALMFNGTVAVIQALSPPPPPKLGLPAASHLLGKGGSQ
jgi:hypothetical protein